MKTNSLGFIGGGRITKIILQAFENDGITFEKVVVTDTNQAVLDALKLHFSKIEVGTNNLQEVVQNEIVFVALHPPVLMEMMAKIKDLISKETILISLAPKLTIEKIAGTLGGFANIARMNPSAAAIVNKGVNPISFSKEMPVDSKNKLLELMRSLGSTPVVEESKIEAYAVITAMGHTYFFYQIQKLKELAVSFGMNEIEAQTAVLEMLAGTTETLFHSGLSFNEVVDLVPVKPMAEVEETIKGYYDQYLTGVYNKIKP
ncbi:MAG: NAD(P)-binding domain-containing protein [Salinivirgaceae bacterium]